MPIIERFAPPSGLTDLSAENRPRWSEFLARFFAQSKEGNPDANDGPRGQFLHPLVDDVDGDMVTADITWTAFPRQVIIQSASDLQRWRSADRSRGVQDEYCEWSVSRDAQGQIKSVAFTSEGPEYWRVLASLQPETVLELYQKNISPEVHEEDIFPNGQYDPFNRWNNGTAAGAMHLIQRNNTLSAEIELAAGASIVRRSGGQIVEETQALIACSQYGAAERHSDPHIGSQVNTLARQGRRVSLYDPVGLYIAKIDLEDFATPTANVAPKDCWHVIRGGDRPVRVVFSAPDGEDFTVSDVTIAGKPIRYGAQIADKMSIGLTGWATTKTDYLSIVDGCLELPEEDTSLLEAIAPIFSSRRR